MSKNKNHCTVPGCDRMGPYKLYCTMHYQRMKKTGSTGPAESERVYGEPITAQCEVDGCEKTVRSRNSPYCETHYYRLRRNGTLDTIAPRVPDAECIVDGCSAPARYSDGHCRNHRLGLDRNGDYLNHAEGHLSPRWLSDEDVTYSAVHQRVHKTRGSAKNHTCVDCGGQAKHWSYNHKDPGERFEQYQGYSIPYSIDPSFYEPRCVKCHKKLDLAEVKRRHEEADAA